MFSRNELDLGLLWSRSSPLFLPLQLGATPADPRQETGNEHLGSGVLGGYRLLLLHYRFLCQNIDPYMNLTLNAQAIRCVNQTLGDGIHGEIIQFCKNTKVQNSLYEICMKWEI